MNKEQFQEALDLCNDYINVCENSEKDRLAFAYLQRAQVYYQNQQYDWVISDVTTAIKNGLERHDPDELAGAYHLRGIAYMTKGDIKNAMPDFKKATVLGIDLTELIVEWTPVYEDLLAKEKKQFDDDMAKAKTGDIEACYQVARQYEQGCGVEKDWTEATKWFLKAAEGGHIDAMYDVHLAYHNGYGVKESSSKAKKWFKLALKNGQYDVLCEMGYNYREGDGVRKNLKKARMYYSRAAQMKNDKDDFAKNWVKDIDEELAELKAKRIKQLIIAGVIVAVLIVGYFVIKPMIG